MMVFKTPQKNSLFPQDEDEIDKMMIFYLVSPVHPVKIMRAQAMLSTQKEQMPALLTGTDLLEMEDTFMRVQILIVVTVFHLINCCFKINDFCKVQYGLVHET